MSARDPGLSTASLFSVQAGTKQNPLGKTSPEISGDLQQGIRLNPQQCIALVSSPYSSTQACGCWKRASESRRPPSPIYLSLKQSRA